MIGQALLKHRSVVSSFIIKYPENGLSEGKPLVALFKRSDKVSTYRHHLAPCSGGIESTDTSPLAAAWRELQEETTLTPGKLELLRQGKSYTFSDPSVGRQWTIYPFAFRLRAPDSAIQIDWEHDGWGWYDPMAVEDSDAFGGVPRLAESLRRVWFEKDLGDGPGSAGAVLAQGLGVLQTDHQSGARQLAGVALGLLRDVVKALEGTGEGAQGQAPSTAAWWTQVRIVAWHIWKNGRESMGAAILSVLLDALKNMEIALAQEEPKGSPRAALQALEECIARRAASSTELVAAVLLGYLEERLLNDRVPASSPRPPPKPLSILTLSESSTVAPCLEHLMSHSRFPALDVRILESRPLFEGVSLAATLAQHAQAATTANTAAAATTVTIYTDAATALAAQGVDVVLLGADRIAANGDVSNKTGSLPAVLSAKHENARVLILGETDKIAPPGDPCHHVVEDNDPAQLTRAWSMAANSERVRTAARGLETASTSAAANGTTSSVTVRVSNVCFEWVPHALVDAYVTEHGIWTVDRIGKHSEALGKEVEKVFGEL